MQPQQNVCDLANLSAQSLGAFYSTIRIYHFDDLRMQACTLVHCTRATL